jgi:hypothetical protein
MKIIFVINVKFKILVFNTIFLQHFCCPMTQVQYLQKLRIVLFCKNYLTVQLMRLLNFEKIVNYIGLKSRFEKPNASSKLIGLKLNKKKKDSS